MLKKTPRSTSLIAGIYVGLTVILTINIIWLQGGLQAEGHPSNFGLSLLVLPLALFLATIASITVVVFISIIDNPGECIKRSIIYFVIVICVAISISSFFVDKVTIVGLIIYAPFMLLIFAMMTKSLFSQFGSQNEFTLSENRKLSKPSGKRSIAVPFLAAVLYMACVAYAVGNNDQKKEECEKPFKEIERKVATNYLNCQSDQESHHGKPKKSAQFLETLGSSNNSPSKIKRSVYEFYLEGDLPGYSVDDCKVELKKHNSYFRENIFYENWPGKTATCFDDSSIDKLCQEIDMHANCLVGLAIK